jgi:4-hydroxy-2-oxoheptanedioate aldolase
MQNTTKQKLKDGQTVFGCFIRNPGAATIEVMAYQGWDFLVFDAEHGPIQPLDCEHMARAAELRGVTPLVRVTRNVPHVIARYMDTGVQGLLVPMVNSAGEAEAAVRSVKYHPRGERGLAGVRSNEYAQNLPLSACIANANAETLVTLQVETAAAVEALPEMLAVNGVDVIFIGPTDLSNSYGQPGNLDHPDVAAALDRVVELVTATDVALGIMVGNADAARRWQDRGARYITIGFEALLRQACTAYLGGV